MSQVIPSTQGSGGGSRKKTNERPCMLRWRDGRVDALHVTILELIRGPAVEWLAIG